MNIEFKSYCDFEPGITVEILKAQLLKTFEEIKKRKAKKICVCTNEKLIAKYNYESVGFKLAVRKKNRGKADFMGDYLYYELELSDD